MNCREVDELLAAYALDAVDEHERAAIAAHLATCDAHEDLAGLLGAAAGLALTVDEREPSTALEGRLLASAQVPPVAVRPARARWGRWPAAIAAGLLLLAAGFGAGRALTPAAEPDSTLVQVVQRDAAWMRAEAAPGQSPVRVTLAGLDRQPDGVGYQIWAIRDSGWVTVGICNTDDDGWWDGDFDFALEAGDALAVTVEPRTGSPAPSGELVLISAAWERAQ